MTKIKENLKNLIVEYSDQSEELGRVKERLDEEGINFLNSKCSKIWNKIWNCIEENIQIWKDPKQELLEENSEVLIFIDLGMSHTRECHLDSIECVFYKHLEDHEGADWHGYQKSFSNEFIKAWQYAPKRPCDIK